MLQTSRRRTFARNVILLDMYFSGSCIPLNPQLSHSWVSFITYMSHWLKFSNCQLNKMAKCLPQTVTDTKEYWLHRKCKWMTPHYSISYTDFLGGGGGAPPEMLCTPLRHLQPPPKSFCTASNYTYFDLISSYLVRDRSLFMAGGGTEEKCFSWQKFCWPNH
jgi:hypothetical protein